MSELADTGTAFAHLDFCIAGAQKAGTSALRHYLAQHPGICMSEPKEPHVFDDPALPATAATATLRTWANDRYRPAMRHYRAGQMAGEATPIYLYWSWLAPSLHRYNPALKLIVCLRDPIQRAMSQYRMEKARGRESRSLAGALLAERARLRRDRDNRDWHSSWRHHAYLDRGRYRRQIDAWLACFPPSQILLVDQIELLQRHQSVVSRVLRFLGVAQDIDVPATKQNVGPPPAGMHGPMEWSLRVLMWKLLREYRSLRLEDPYRHMWGSP